MTASNLPRNVPSCRSGPSEREKLPRHKVVDTSRNSTAYRALSDIRGLQIEAGEGKVRPAPTWHIGVVKA
ncbi:hypothetical protein EMQ_2900 [Acetobacter aceti NBRC 14818]|uniref:Uncharacterized protein n=2 Tax=Acetobacter aceti TaxID=435 RepID=A0A6S6PHH8_ACEAC|nr:hypothetical protein [Acetobacter aceti]BCI66326.1 hypothetical protein AAJCM20276_09500 [Acetobacter aceti]BCK77294.1 hypothetical protein EMQ_2900 [Acetobacter aceti NBRC 14818]GAN58381.1 hypothetical protein Abac_048_015 [Acetobacter aceti NBRC 14818]